MARRAPGCAGLAGRLACVLVVMGALAGSPVAASASGLPDGRGWEMVSAADKNGGDVIGNPERVRASDDGTVVGYASLSEFADSVGGGAASDYLAVRSPLAGGQGWVTHGIIPPQTALPLKAVVDGFEPRYEQDFSPDGSSGVLFAWRALTANPLVANVANLYLRDDLRSPGAGHYTLITSCPLCLGPLGPDKLVSDPIMVASTPDLSHVLFESQLDLAPGANGGALKLYDWDARTQVLHLAGVLPDGSGALDSAAGIGHGRFEHRHAISDDGRKVFFQSRPAGIQNIYMRLDESSTVQLNRSELSGGPDTPQDAQYGDASADGTRVFFTTTERLTDDAPANTADKLYQYDTTKPDSDPHNLTYIADFVQGVVGSSADGHTVYFYDGAQLIAGQPPLPYSAAMYVWHEGQIGFVANLPGQDIDGLVEGVVTKTARVSPSGDLAFLSQAPLGANVAGSCPQTNTRACKMLYVYRLATQSLDCASCSPAGTAPTSDVEGVVSVGSGGAAVNGHLNRALTDDGRRVFFTTADPLLPEDVNGKRDVYEYDTVTHTVSLISSGRSTADSYFMESTPSGDDAYFITREQLVGWDTDSNYDLYDARIGGGLPNPTPPPPPCNGQDCHPQPTTPPSFAPTASQTTHSTGNLPTPNTKHRPKHCPRATTHTHTHHTTHCTKKKRHRGNARRRARRRL